MINHREGTPYIARSADLITNNFDHRQILLSFKNKIYYLLFCASI